MKNFKYLVLFLFSIACKGQNPIIDITSSRFGQPAGYYMKDINNLLNQFEGTYLYTNGATSLKITLVKKIQQYNGSFYEDLIIGEYQYIENGIEKINTLNKINIVYNDQRSHSIDGNLIVNNNFRYWKCPSCSSNEKRLSCSFNDPSNERYANITIRKNNENNQEKIIIKISHVSKRVDLSLSADQNSNFSIPLGEMTLLKI
jgi:hypothetical protein